MEPVPSVMSLGVHPGAPMDISEDRADAFSHAMMPVEDIDANDCDNPQLVSEYVIDIYDYMRSLEVRTYLILEHIFTILNSKSYMTVQIHHISSLFHLC